MTSVTSIMRKQIIQPILLQIALFLIQFVIIPSVYYISPYDTARCLVVIISTTTFVLIFGMVKYKRLLGWLLGLIVYGVLIMLYHPNNIYGIGNGIFDFDVITITIFIFLNFAIQLIILCCIKLFHRLKN